MPHLASVVQPHEPPTSVSRGKRCECYVAICRGSDMQATRHFFLMVARFGVLEKHCREHAECYWLCIVPT